MDVQFVKVLQQGSERCSFGHLCKGVDILGEALTTITEFTIRTRNVGVGVVDIARQQHAGVYLTPVAAHLLAVFAAG